MTRNTAERYAVGVFNLSAQMRAAREALSQAGYHGCRMNLLGCTTLGELTGSSERGNLQDRFVQPFQQNDNTIYCSAGNLAERLQDGGALDLEEALQTWMVPRQAARLASDVRIGCLLLWIEVRSPQEEQSACEVLLNSAPLRVKVHDLKALVVNPRASSHSPAMR